MKIEPNIPLSRLTTLRVGGPVHKVITVESVSDVPEAVASARQMHLPWSVIGGGSNILASDDYLNRVVIHMQTRGISVVSEDDDSVIVRAQAGEPWSALVSWSVERNLWGIENLAGIPGTVGATPVQNVGAYGVEVSMRIVAVHVFDSARDMFVDLSCELCVFGYRDSIFKHADGEQFIIASVVFRLSKRAQPVLAYKDIADRFAGVDFNALTPRVIANEVIDIRAKKFPDVSQVGTAGSFFKNPVISHDLYNSLKARFSDLPGHEEPNGIKIPLAWVLDTICHLKGYRVGDVALFEKQPLVLVAYAGARAHDINVFANEIAKRVYDATNIVIEREVRELK